MLLINDIITKKNVSLKNRGMGYKTAKITELHAEKSNTAEFFSAAGSSSNYHMPLSASSGVILVG
jgi:hypothetical protein